MKFIEGGIYTNKNDDIWVCFFEKDSECRNITFIYTVVLYEEFNIPNHFVIENHLQSLIQKNTLISFNKRNLKYVNDDFWVNGYLGKISDNLRQQFIKKLKKDSLITIE